ncbi:MAG: adenylate/guanylate cyclase domain-containing protein [bacterium]
MNANSKKDVSRDIVIAAIDNKSLGEIGRWPWDRKTFARMVANIIKGGAKVVAIDVLYPEKTKGDKELIDALNNGRTVLATSFSFEEENSETPNFLSILENSSYKLVNESITHDTPEAIGTIRPFDELASRVRYLGHINMFPDIDGTVRKEFVAIKYNDIYLPSMAVQAYKVYKNVDDDNVIFVPGKSLIIDKLELPLDVNSGFLINYTGREGTFKRISMSDIYFERVKREELENKIVLIGATALGIYDLRVTPTSQNMPGIEKHAYVVQNLLEGRFFRHAENRYTLFVMFFFYLMYIFFSKRFRVRGLTILGFANFLIYTIFCFYVFHQFKLWLNFVYPIFVNFSIFLGVIVYKYAAEERSGREIRKIFSSYVSDKIVNELIKNPEMAKLGGVKKEITVLFADARGFTTFSEHHTPEEVVHILNELLGAMTDVIMANDGTLDKFVGDEIMALWNVPLDQKNHAELAVKCAVEMIRKNRQLVEKWKAEGKDPLMLGIGINTGEAIAGNMGAEGKKMDYTVIGDTVNLGARVEALTRPLDADILITEYTYERIKDAIGNITDIDVVECEPQKVKGKAEPIRIFKIVVK